jgi:hypothetical protein
MARQGHEWAIRKTGPAPLVSRADKLDYPQHERAARAYTIYISGYTEDEIAKFLGCTLEDVAADMIHMQSCIPTRTIIAHENDRNRILIQRSESQKYRSLLSQALSLPVEQYLQAGIAPTGPMKEFREAVGMVAKPEGIGIHLSQTQVNVGGGGGSGIGSSEDLLRSVMAKLQTNYDEAKVVDVEAEPEEDSASQEEDAVPDVD